MLNLSNLLYDNSGFSWILESDRTDVLQDRYHIQVSSKPDFSKTVWDTGETKNDRSVFVPSTGLHLPTCETVYWRVRIIDNHGDDSGWSEPQSIITGPGKDDWQVNFITPETDEDAKLSKGKLLRAEFPLDGEVERATVYVTAHGMYELFINGQRVGDALLTPGWTEYDKRVLYQTWDVTGLLRDGKNAVGATLGAGWYKGDLGWLTLGGLRNLYGNKNALLVQMDVRFNDGRRKIIGTNDKWKYSDGPIQYSELYHGEIYDARQEKPGWNLPGYDDSRWSDVKVFDYEYSPLTPQDGPLVRRQEVLSAKSMTITPKGETVLDFGQNISGWVRFTVSGQSGDVAKLRHAEVLDSDGNFYTENLRAARNEITYTLRGGEKETFEPHFTFQGFRYVCIDSWPDDKPNPDDFQAVVIHSDMQRTGEFECSHKLLNQLHSNILWGLKGNFVDIPTDCPQRDERLGWTGDAQIFINTSTFLMDTRAFFVKWLRDLRAAQFANGGVPFVVPDILTGKFGEGDVIANSESVTGWGDAAVICPWTLWLAYGDKETLRENYDSMKRWVEYIRARASDGLLWNTDYQLGDWVALDAKEGSYFGATATDLIATAYYAKCAELLAKSAKALGFEDDANQYKTLRDEIGKAYENEFFSPNGRLVSPTQTAHILSLAFGMTPEKHKRRTINELLQLLKDNDGHLTTGFLGTPYFCGVLADNGHLAEAYDLLLLEDYPSWLYQVTKGATTVWEHWDGIKPDGSMWSANMNSFNHYAYGSVGEFLYRVIGGIDSCEEKPGFKKIIVKPRPGGGITSARTSVLTTYGRVSTDWRIEKDKFMLKVEVPHNTTAIIHMPDGSQQEFGSGTYEISSKHR